jgi:hypothetical protein
MMGRPSVPPEKRRVKCHVGNVMLPGWVSEKIRRDARRTKRFIKDVIEEWLTNQAGKPPKS